MVGTKYGRLLVLAETRDQRNRPAFLCICDCGTKCIKRAIFVRCGDTKSCGCLGIEYQKAKKTHNRTHGMSKTVEYRTWARMITRCTNKTSPDFSYYGARGITVCDEWIRSFTSFYRDMGPRPSPLHSLERKDNNGPYSKNNCVWATRKQQARNRRTVRVLTHQGHSLSLPEWAEIIGLPLSTLHDRLQSGWSVERALSTPRKSL